MKQCFGYVRVSTVKQGEGVSLTAQREAIDALYEVTGARAFRDAKAIAQPYGAASTPSDQVGAGVYTALGDPPILVGADHRYLSAMERLFALVHAEATRRLQAREADEAAELLMRAMLVARQLADRETIREAGYGFDAMAEMFSRLRDVLYVDSRTSRSASIGKLRDIVDRLDPEEGPIGLDKLNFPRANRIAAEQLIEMVYDNRGRIDREAFVAAMGGDSADRPLHRFTLSRAAENRAAGQIDSLDVERLLGQVYGDYIDRWSLDQFDPLLGTEFGEDQLMPNMHLAAHRAMQWTDAAGAPRTGKELFELRQRVRVEMVGTRAAAALIGWSYEVGRLPTAISTIRPNYMRELEADPFDPGAGAGTAVRPPLKFFVPIRDGVAPDPRSDPPPHRLSFTVPLLGTEFGEDQLMPNMHLAAHRAMQ
ncbi:MAG: hypothetical protein AAFU70_10515, partial [Planctomycetota bacterium]